MAATPVPLNRTSEPSLIYFRKLLLSGGVLGDGSHSHPHHKDGRAISDLFQQASTFSSPGLQSLLWSISTTFYFFRKRTGRRQPFPPPSPRCQLTRGDRGRGSPTPLRGSVARVFSRGSLCSGRGRSSASSGELRTGKPGLRQWTFRKDDILFLSVLTK